MTAAMIREWCVAGAAEIAAAGGPAVQTPERMLALGQAHLPALRRCAERLYGRWLEGLRR
jgi:hypothetical protein